jgi:hypothetical protein
VDALEAAQRRAAEAHTTQMDALPLDAAQQAEEVPTTPEDALKGTEVEQPAWSREAEIPGLFAMHAQPCLCSMCNPDMGYPLKVSGPRTLPLVRTVGYHRWHACTIGALSLTCLKVTAGKAISSRVLSDGVTSVY